MSSLIGSILGYKTADKTGDLYSNTAQAAEHGVLNATKDAQDAINTALGTNATNVNAAGDKAIGAVHTATGNANDYLQNLLTQQTGNLQPNIAAGQKATQQLSDYASGPDSHFNFNLQDYLNSDAMKFERDQGAAAIQNSQSASGLGNSGATLKALTTYGQGVASKYYQQAFENANNQFNTNHNATLANLSTLINSGLTATGQTNTANASLGAPQATNTMNAGLYEGNTNTNLAQFLAGQNLQGQETSGSYGMTGAKQAGDFAFEGVPGIAASIAGKNSAITGGLAGLASIFGNIFPGLGL